MGELIGKLGAFTDGRPFWSEQMQRLTRQTSFSETGFILPSQDGGDVRTWQYTRAEGTADSGQCLRVGGQAVVVARGEFRLG